MSLLLQRTAALVHCHRHAIPSKNLSIFHNYSGIILWDPVPGLQVLRLLKVLGAGNAEASDQMSDILAQVRAPNMGSGDMANGG